MPAESQCPWADRLLMSQNEDWKQMFGAAPIERSSLTSLQKSKSPSPSTSMTLARSEKELTQLLMSGSSTEHLALTRSGSAGQLGLSSTASISPDVASVHAPLMTPSMRQPVENMQRGMLPMLWYCLYVSTTKYNTVRYKKTFLTGFLHLEHGHISQSSCCNAAFMKQMCFRVDWRLNCV